MGSGCGALNCLANAVRVLACIIPSHFAVEKATKQMMSQNMMVIQLGEILRLPFIVQESKNYFLICGANNVVKHTERKTSCASVLLTPYLSAFDF